MATKKEADGEHSAGDYLVVDDPESPSTWHLRVKSGGKPDHTLMGAAWAALHGGYRGNKYEGPNKSAAIDKLKKMYSSENMDTPGQNMEAQRVFDALVATKPGDPYRLLPFGQIKRANGGPAREFTPAMAAAFKLPHFQPPMKLGSHDDTTPAGGHIKALEVRADGLYAIPELTEKGAKAWADGDYKYHSPEIIWPGGGIEDATTGEFIPGPLIVGDALLHTPALGEATALYTSQVKQGEPMTAETVQVEKGVWDQLAALFGKQPDKPEPQIPDEYKAAMKERDELKALQAKAEADKLHAETVTTLTAELKKPERFSAAYKDDKAATEAAEQLAAMPQPQRDWVMQQLAAMSKRIDYSKLTTEIGSGGTGVESDPRKAFAGAVEAKMKAAKVDYMSAYNLVKTEAPELFEAYAAFRPGKEK